MSAVKAPPTEIKAIAKANLIQSEDGKRRAAQIIVETTIDIKDELRLNLLLAKCLTVMADTERKVSEMSEPEAVKALKELGDRQSVAMAR